MNSPSNNRFDRQTLIRFWKILKLFFSSEVKWRALFALVLLGAFSLSLSGLNVVRSYVDRDFMNALAQRDEDRFFHEMLLYFLVFGALIPMAVFYRYCEERLGLLWRDWLSKRIIDEYLSKGVYYKISLERHIDNPDQRIEEDIRTFTSSSLSFTLILFNSIVALIAFVSILWSISGTLMIGAIIYALIGSVITYFLGRPLIGLSYTQLKREADYRYKLVNIRDFSESIAFYRGERRERLRVKERVRDVVSNMKSIINWNRNLGFFTNGYTYILAILPTIIVAPLYLQGKIEFGVVIQAGGAFGQVLGALSIIVVHFGGLSSLAATTNRLGAFWETIEMIQRERAAGPRIELEDGEEISLDRVTVLTPQRDQVLVRELSFAVKPNERLLITGPSGSGKSSILRVIAGLWVLGSGRVTRPALNRCMFVPQRPYMVLGSFRSQLVYGCSEDDIDQKELNKIIEITGLTHTVERIGGLEADEDWRGLLSLGEQELIAFARIFISRPEVVFLDEATSAIDSSRRTVLYEELKKRGIQFISVGPSNDVEAFHDVILELQGRGGWILRRRGEAA